MLKAGLLQNKTETKSVKIAKMVEFIKTCDQCPRRFNFGSFFSSIILLPPFCWEKYIFRKRCSGGMDNFLLPVDNDKNLGKSFAWENG